MFKLRCATSAQLYDRAGEAVGDGSFGVALAGCARDDGEADLPDACTDAAPFVTALRDAPEPVRVEEGVSISDCLARDSSTGDVQAVGAVLLESAQRLGEGGDGVALGYLVGAPSP